MAKSTYPASVVLFLAALTGSVNAQSMSVFTSREGGFSIELPGTPTEKETKIGDSNQPEDVQHQFTLGDDQGVYLISYQDNPNLAGATPQQLSRALLRARDGLKKAFAGEILEDRTNELDQVHPGREIRLSIPAAKGIARCRIFLVGSRLYQVMVVGVPEFADSERSSSVLASFALVAEKAEPAAAK